MTAGPFAFPDAEALLIGWFSGQLSGVRCVATLPAELESRLPVLQVVRVGGAAQTQPWSPGGPLHERIAVDLDAYAGTRADAADVARTACTRLGELRGVSTGGAVITEVIANTGPAWRPDYNPHVARFGATYEVVLRPEWTEGK